MTTVRKIGFSMEKTSSFQDAEYIKIAEEAWEEAVEIAKSSEGWKEEKNDKKTVRFISCCIVT